MLPRRANQMLAVGKTGTATSCLHQCFVTPRWCSSWKPGRRETSCRLGPSAIPWCEEFTGLRTHLGARVGPMRLGLASARELRTILLLHCCTAQRSLGPPTEQPLGGPINRPPNLNRTLRLAANKEPFAEIQGFLNSAGHPIGGSYVTPVRSGT